MAQLTKNRSQAELGADQAERSYQQQAGQQMPTPGRIVYYCDEHNPTVDTPAIIQSANSDGTVNLFVIMANRTQFVNKVLEGHPGIRTPKCWTWPAMQGRAADTSSVGSF